MSASALALYGGEAVAQSLARYDWPRLHEEDEVAVLSALRNGYWGGLGDDFQPHRQFEAKFAEYHQANFAVLVPNGTIALEMSLRAGGVRPGDEVIVPAITFIASASAVVSVGAVPVFVDVEPDTCQISPAAVEAAMTPKTRCVIAVHFGGYLVDLDAMLAVARKHGVFVIEDCAHAQGAAWRNRRVGSWGDFGSFSFQHSKSLSSGEGGVVLMNDRDMYEQAMLIRNIGRRPDDRSYYHYICASNWRLGGLQAALLLSQFGRFPGQAEERQRNYVHLTTELGKVEGIRCLPHDERITQMGCYFAVLDFDSAAFGCSRDQFVRALKAEGVEAVTTGYNRSLHQETAFQPHKLRPLLHESIELPDYASMDLPHAQRWSERMVTILHYYLLGDRQGVDAVVAAVDKIKEHASELNRVEN